MPLRHTEGREPVDQVGRQGIKFTMMVADGDEAPVSCFASFAALHTIEGGDLPSKAERMERFERHRVTFERIASAKYDVRWLEPDASVFITAADLEDPHLT